MSQPSPTTDRASPPQWRATELLAWLGLAVLWTAAWSWGSVLVAEHFSPALVFPVLSGIVFGGGCIVAMRISGLASRRWLVGGTLVFAAVLVIGQHYVGYRLARLATERQHEGIVDMFAAFPQLQPSFAKFLQTEAQQGRPWFWLTLRGSWAWASWGADGLLEMLAAAVTVGIAARRPYCRQCRTWYRTVRSGTVEAQSAAALAEQCGSPVPSGGIEYRIAQCQTGCGQARLELIALGSGQRIAWTWLDREQAERVRVILDGDRRHDADRENAATTGGNS